jgi:serine/threonine protein kinase
MALQAGTRFDPYEVLSLIGAGGMGEVYQARYRRLDRKVAVKVLAPELARDADSAPASSARPKRSRPSITRTSAACTTSAESRTPSISYSNCSKARRWRPVSNAGRCRSHKSSALASRSRTPLKRHTDTASFTGI